MGGIDELAVEESEEACPEVRCFRRLLRDPARAGSFFRPVKQNLDSDEGCHA